MIRYLFISIQIVEYKSPSPAVSVQDQFRSPWCKKGGDLLNSSLNLFLRAGSIGAPCGPAFPSVLQISNNHGSVTDHLSQVTGLGADMLNVIVPVITLLQSLPESLFNCIAVGQRIDYKQHTVTASEAVGRCIYEHP